MAKKRLPKTVTVFVPVEVFVRGGRVGTWAGETEDAHKLTKADRKRQAEDWTHEECCEATTLVWIKATIPVPTPVVPVEIVVDGTATK